MKSIAAHYDGHQVRLDEEVVLRPQTRLLVTILEDVDGERADFLALAGAAFADSYGDDEVEYSHQTVTLQEIRPRRNFSPLRFRV